MRLNTYFSTIFAIFHDPRRNYSTIQEADKLDPTENSEKTLNENGSLEMRNWNFYSLEQNKGDISSII